MQSCRAGGVVDHVPEGGGIPGGDTDGLGAGVDGLPGQEFEVAAAGAERHNLKKVRGAVDDVNRLCADGTGGPEEDDFARLHDSSIPHRAGAPRGYGSGVSARRCRESSAAALTQQGGGVTWKTWSGPRGSTRRSTSSPGRCCSAASPPSIFVAFLSSLNQFPALLGERGLLPVPDVSRGLQPPGPAQPVPLALLGPAAADGLLERHGHCRHAHRRAAPARAAVGSAASRSWPCGCCTCRS